MYALHSDSLNSLYYEAYVLITVGLSVKNYAKLCP